MKKLLARTVRALRRLLRRGSRAVAAAAVLVAVTQGGADWPTDEEVVAQIRAVPPHYTGISRVTQASAASNGSTGITISCQGGDLLLVGAYNNASTTQPTLATGYTSIQSAGNNTNALRVAYKWATGSETTFGTWTNATDVAGVVLRGAHWIGTSLAASAVGSGTVATMTYPALTLNDATGISWVVAFGGNRTSLANTAGVATAPTGLTTESNTTRLAVFDSEGGKASWTAQTVGSNTATGWRTCTVEVRGQTAQSTAAGVPQLIDWRGTAAYVNAETVYHFPLTSKSLAGNCVGIAFMGNLGTATLTSVKGSDGVSLTSCGNSFTGAGSGQTYWQYIYPNCPAGLTEIVVTFSAALSAAGAFVQAHLVQFYNVATTSPIDNSGAGTGAETASGVAHQPGALTVAANSVVWAAMFQVSVNPWNGAGVAPGGGATMLGAELYTGSGQQYQVASAGSVNPRFYLNGDQSAGVIAVALKAATAGTAPAATGAGKAPRVIGIQDCNIANGISTFTTQFSARGDLVVLSWSDSVQSGTTTDCKVTPTDNRGNTWTMRQDAAVLTTVRTDIQIGDTDAAALNASQALLLTGTTSHVSGGGTLTLYDVLGSAAPGSYVTGSTNTNSNTLTTTWDVISVTPTGANQLVFVSEDQDNGTVSSGTGGTNFVFNAPYPEGTNGGTFGDGFVNDRLIGYTTSTDASQITFGATVESPATQAGNNGGVTAVYAGPAAPQTLLIGPFPGLPGSILGM